MDNRGIDFVKANIVAGTSVGGDGADAQTNHSNAHRPHARVHRNAPRMVEHEQAYTAGWTEIGRGLAPLVGLGILDTVHDTAVAQHKRMPGGIGSIALDHRRGAVKVAYRNQTVVEFGGNT